VALTCYFIVLIRLSLLARRLRADACHTSPMRARDDTWAQLSNSFYRPSSGEKIKPLPAPRKTDQGNRRWALSRRSPKNLRVGGLYRPATSELIQIPCSASPTSLSETPLPRQRSAPSLMAFLRTSGGSDAEKTTIFV